MLASWQCQRPAAAAGAAVRARQYMLADAKLGRRSAAARGMQLQARFELVSQLAYGMLG